MSLAFPLPLNAFWDRIRVASIQWRLSHPQSVSQLADGTILRASRGAPLWRATVTTDAYIHEESAEYEAILALLDMPGASFLAYDPRKAGLTASGSGSATIGSISGDRREISLSGFTGTITPGDFISFTYGSSPLRYALHRAVAGATNAGSFEVVPPVSPLVSTGRPVTYEKPFAKFTLEPEPDYGQGRPIFSAGATFGMVQTLG